MDVQMQELWTFFNLFDTVGEGVKNKKNKKLEFSK